jgi:endoglucanase
MEETAEKENIKTQREILLFGGTDARAMQISREGMPAGCLSIPSRYTHSPSEMVDMDDVNESIKLLAAMVSAEVKF